MTIHAAVKYKGFLMDCAPVMRDDHAFVAQVVISREDNHAVREHTFSDLSVENATQAAISFAKSWGRHWIDLHGAEFDKFGQLGAVTQSR
jgi:hypothetical protein